MCGIFGVASISKRPDFERFEKALCFIQHRGPDFKKATQVDDSVILGHTRLSIIDLSTSNHQPFAIDDRYILSYNGEVYNYLEIRKELELEGIRFHTSGDTEVLLQAYIKWGDDCVKKFNGMWAFAIYDKQEKKLFCSRDRFGVKPFNYYSDSEEFIFSSEIKPIISYRPACKVPNYNMIANYCYKSIGAQARETWFKDVFRLPPAHNLVWQKGEIRISRYWDYPTQIDQSLSFEKAKEKFEQLFVDATKLRMRSDVTVGSTLSSGMDSTSIVGVINRNFADKIETFTAYNKNGTYTQKDKAVFKEDVDLDESSVVKELNKNFNVNPHYIEVSFTNFLDKLSETIYFLESGHSSPATISIHQVYKEARKKVKVLLEGQGADELLAGYIVDSFPHYLLELLKVGKFRKAWAEFGLFRKTYSTKYLAMIFLRSFDNAFFNQLKNSVKRIRIFDQKTLAYKYVKDNNEYTPAFNHGFNKYLYRQHTSGLVNLLHYGDALSMAESIECRLPFMDYRLVEFAFTLPFNFKVDELKGKHIQRQSLKSYIPDYIYNSKIKIGFATPLDNLFNDSKEIEQILLHENCGTLFDNQGVADLLRAHRSGRQNHSTMLFRILSAKIWYRNFFQNTNEAKQQSKA